MAKFSKSLKAGKNALLSSKKPRESVTEEESDDETFNIEFGRVRFAEAVLRYEILCLDDYSERELKKCWYTEEDKAKMSKAHNKLVRRYELGKRCKRNMSYRGLECWTDEGAARLDKAISKTVDAVMDEQDEQWATGVDNWDRISKLARSSSKECRSQARKTGQEDEFEARLAYETFGEDAGSDEDSTGTMHLLVKKKRSARRRRRGTNSGLSSEEKAERRLRRQKLKAAKM
eukprot:scaffold1605_cov141-Cylindrotheca_fusiformis.AAC.11